MLVVNGLKVAKFFATVKHAAQLYSGLPYTHHLAAVHQVVLRFKTQLIDQVPEGANLDTIDALEVSAWLHDVVEDTGTKLKEVEEMFGARVAHLVGAVTNEPGANRKIRHALTYPKIRAAGWAAVALKLADRIANVEAGGKLVDMYQKEHDDFRRALYTPGENEAMWAHLDALLKAEAKTAGHKE